MHIMRLKIKKVDVKNIMSHEYINIIHMFDQGYRYTNAIAYIVSDDFKKVLGILTNLIGEYVYSFMSEQEFYEYGDLNSIASYEIYKRDQTLKDLIN